MPRTLLLASLAACTFLGGWGARGATAEEAAPPRPPTYADRDAAWWVGELRQPTTREVATAALRKIGRAALPALLEAWEGADAGTRQAILHALGQLEGPLPELTRALPRLYDERLSEAQAMRLLALVRTAGASPETLELLARLGAHASKDVRDASAAALRALPMAEHLHGEALSRLLASSEPALVQRVLEALRERGPQARHAIPLVDELLLRPATRTPGVLAAAFAALRSMRPGTPFDAPTYARLLEAHLAGADLAPLLLLAREQEATPDLLRALVACHGHTDAGTRADAAAVLGSLRLTPALLTPELFALLEAPDPGLAQALLAALQRLGPAAAPAAAHVLDLLRRILDAEAGVQAGMQAEGGALAIATQALATQAVATLRAIEAGGDGVIDVATRLALTAPDPLASEAVRLIAAAGGDEAPATGRLLEVVGARTGATREVALGALGSRRRPLPEEAPVLRRLLQEPDASVHGQVARLLVKVGSRDALLLDLVARRLQERTDDTSLHEAFVRLARDDPDHALETEADLAPALWTVLVEAFLKEPTVLAREPRGSLAVVAFDRWLQSDPSRVAPRTIASLLAKARLAPQEPEALEALGRWLDHPTPELVKVAAEALGASPAGQAHRFGMLTSPHVERRRAALRDWSWSPGQPLPDGARVALDAALGDSDPVVRAIAALWLAYSVPRGASALGSPEPLTGNPRALALASLDALRLGRPGDRAAALSLYVQLAVPLPEALPLLHALLAEETRDFTPGQLARALALTSERADARVVETLRADLESDDLVRRADALLVFALWRIETERVLAALPSLLGHPSSRVALRALAACEALGPFARAVAPALIERVERGEALGHMGDALRALVAIAPGDDGALSALRRWWLDPERPWRVSALPPVLVRLGAPGAHLLADGLGDPALREASLKSLQQMGPGARPVLARLREALAAQPKDAALAKLVASLDAR